MTTSTLASQTHPRDGLPEDLDRILRETSRSVYLTLKVAPRPMRRCLMLGYLFCRAADTIADTAVLPPDRRIDMLARFRSQFEAADVDAAAVASISGVAELAEGAGFSAAERDLLQRLPDCFELFLALDAPRRELLRRLLTTLTEGMASDLRRFPAESDAHERGELGWLRDDAELDRYCYHVAGCVGEFWTDLQLLAVPAMQGVERESFRELGVRFGKGLQMTNVLRDVPADLRIGRCYLPQERLEALGLSPRLLGDAVRDADRGEGDSAERAQLSRQLAPLFHDLLDLTLEHFRAGWEYTLKVPRRAVRLRLACAWPLLIGLDTLARVRGGVERLLEGERLKTPRSLVYQTLISSSVRVLSDTALDRLYRKLERRALRDAPISSPSTRT